MRSADIISFLTLAASASAAHHMAKRNDLGTVAVPTAQDVENAINEWNLDVNTVNSFLERAPGELDDLPTLASDAHNVASNFAAEEPNQLGTLVNWFTSDSNNPDSAPDAFHCAANDLAVGQTIGSTTFNFKSLVLDVFADIVEDANAGNRDAVSNLLDVVNSYRCCNVLPDLDILWRDSAISADLLIQNPVTGGVPITPARPSTCSAFDCSKTVGASTCSTEDNGSFGTPGS
ncbi:hypothetical protein WHR41_01408 [Cladosporium halotolerans]|uniref:Uncharacterized protein n=1 Tax=Cladosporium halotolerans TaxID=1052096 RepID=A0AB34KYX6_9PEZI